VIKRTIDHIQWKEIADGVETDMRAHRAPGMIEGDVPTMVQTLRMVTTAGAKTTPFGTSIGTLEAGGRSRVARLEAGDLPGRQVHKCRPTRRRRGWSWT
jgi:hypothetical protein